MSEERLKEIKNSIDKEYVFEYYDYEPSLFLKHLHQELELYNEVIRLKEENNQLDDIRNANYLSWQDSVARINEAIKYIENTPLYTETYDYNMEDNLELNYVSDEKAHNDLLKILEGKINDI